MISTYRWYLTLDGRAVKEGHPDANSLLVGAGDELSDEDAKRLGVCNCPDHDEAVDEPPAFQRPPANKAVMPTPKEALKKRGK